MPGPTSSAEQRRQAALQVLPGLYGRVPVLCAINLFVAATVVVVSWSVIAPLLLLGWLGLMLAALGLRLLMWHRYHRAPPHVRYDMRWVRRMTGTTGLTGVVWGLGAVVFLAPDTPEHQLFIALTISGIVAGATVALSAHLPVFFAFYLPVLLPYALRLALEPRPGSQGMALLIATFAVAIGVIGRSVHRSLRASEQRYRTVVEDQTELICRYLPDGTLTFVNGAYARYFDRRAEELIGGSFLSFLTKGAREQTLEMIASLSPERPTITYEHLVMLPTGGMAWQQWRDRGIFDSSGALVEIQAVGRDITERKQVEEDLRRARDELERRVDLRTTELRLTNKSLRSEVLERKRVEAELRWSESRLRVALRAARMGVWEQDLASGLFYWSNEMEKLFGLEPDSFSGRYDDFLLLVHPDDRGRVAATMGRASETATGYDLEYRVLRPDGGIRWLACFGERIDAPAAGAHLAGVAIDITERREAEEDAIRLAHHDALTGLPNRRLLEERLEQAIVRARRNKHSVAVMLLDLDNFKHVNDSRGHPVGDRLLCAVAERLGQVLRATDTLARLGGDEFAIVQADLRDPEGAATLAGKLIEALIDPFPIEHEELHTTTSIGISLFPADGDDPALLIKQADVALYRAKAAGRNRVSRFQGWMTAEANARQTLESSLRQTLKDQRFVLYYQPLIHLPSGQITGMEALLRWPQQGRMMLPGSFVPLAEATGLIQPLGDWVLLEACRQAARWHQGGRQLTVTVNLSGSQIRHHDVLHTVERVIGEVGVDPRLIELEITENVFLDPKLGSITSLLDYLVGLGLRLSIDDFGTGYSSLAYLKRMPASTIKIDRSFVQGVGRKTADDAIVLAILALGRSLGMRVVAEGVETQAQLEFLERHGCTDLQGFLIARPQPADEIERFMDGWPLTWARLRESARVA